MKNATQIFRFLLQAASRGEQTALITVTDITGGSPRQIGTHMAVTEAGRYAGSISGGCVEAAIIGEAKRVIAGGQAEQLRLGEGSPYIDLRLPCGGGIDILISPFPALEPMRECCGWLEARRPVLLRLGENGTLAARPTVPDDQTTWHAGAFQVVHDPDMRLIIAGHGEEVLALARLSLAYKAKVTVLSPDTALLGAVAGLGAEAWPLRSGQPSAHLVTDEYSAVVLLFHDHDWEQPLLIQTLSRPAFFIGAMGSHTTQARRLRALKQSGVPAAALARLISPIGLIGAVRDPDTLALSALAQIVSRYLNRTGLVVPRLAEASV